MQNIDEAYKELEVNSIPSNKISRSLIELDYLTINYKLMRFKVYRKKHRNIIKNYMEQLGLKITNESIEWIVFTSEDGGIRAEFSCHYSNSDPKLKIDFKGHFFIHENADLLIRKISLWLLRRFGAFPTISRVDLRQDFYGVKSPFDYFPDFTDENKFHWALRSQPKVSYYANGFRKDISGFNVTTSRYAIVSYDRIEALRKKYRTGNVSKAYYNHYMRIYAGRDVQRLEVRLMHDACKTFQFLFFNRDYESGQQVYKYVLANFARNHVLKDLNPEKPYNLNNLKANEVFSELFYLDEKENYKIFKREIEKKMEIKLEEMVFQKEGKSQKELSRMFAKKLCQANSTYIIQQFLDHAKEVPDMILNELTTYVEEFKMIQDDRKERFRKTLRAFDLTEEEIEEARRKILSDENFDIAFSISKIAA